MKLIKAQEVREACQTRSFCDKEFYISLIDLHW